MSALPLFRLTYFPIHGRALPIRLAAILNGIEWEDHLIRRDEFINKKENNKQYIPRWNGLPEITFYNNDKQPKNNIIVGQSTALLRYISQLKNNNDNDNNYNLYPINNKFDCLLVDEIMDSIEDMIKIIVPSLMEQDEQKKLEMRKGINIQTIYILYYLYLNKYNILFIYNRFNR